MAANPLLYEITNNDWLMDMRYLHQLRESLRLGLSENKTSEKPQKTLLSFYNEDFARINPENVSEVPAGSIAVIKAVGPMIKYKNDWVLSAEEVVEQLDFANNLKNIAGIVLIVDGPGGTVSAIPPFMDFAARKTKPIVALCDLSLSLHYWIPNAIADSMMASNTISASFGSVGVVSNWLDFREAWEKIGVKEYEIYAEQSEHKNEFMRKIRENETEGKKLFQKRHLNPLAEKFQAAVKNARSGLKEDEGVLTGRTFSAEEALSLGMIDSIGNMHQAMQITQALAEVRSI